MDLDEPVVSPLVPVVLLIGIGFVAGRLKLIRGEAVRDLSNLLFLVLVLVQALLFRSLATAHLERLDLTSVALHCIVAGAMFFALLFMRGLNSRSALLALASIFSNTLMIGVPLVQLAHGEAALVLLTLATIVLELLLARENIAAGHAAPRYIAATVARAVKNGLCGVEKRPGLRSSRDGGAKGLTKNMEPRARGGAAELALRLRRSAQTAAASQSTQARMLRCAPDPSPALLGKARGE